MSISNDTIITPGAIENLLACIRSDPKIGWAVPTTSNVSNLQAIQAEYKTKEELTAFARKNNCLDPFRVHSSIWCGNCRFWRSINSAPCWSCAWSTLLPGEGCSSNCRNSPGNQFAAAFRVKKSWGRTGWCWKISSAGRVYDKACHIRQTEGRFV